MILFHCCPGGQDFEPLVFALFVFLPPRRCSGYRCSATAQDLLTLQQKEIKAHENNWKQQGQLYRSIQKVRADLGFEIEQIIGTADENQEA